MTNQDPPPPPISSTICLKARTKGMAGNDGGGGRGGEGVCDPIHETVIVIKQNVS